MHDDDELHCMLLELKAPCTDLIPNPGPNPDANSNPNLNPNPNLIPNLDPLP